MTTIAYSNGIIAYDSRECQGDLIVSDNYDKKKVSNGIIYFITGSPSDFEKFEKAYAGEEVSNCNIYAFVIDQGNLYKSAVCEEDGFWRNPVIEHFAIGSGSRFALTAMDMGATAKEAVKWAMKRDVNTGGRIRAYKIK